MQRAGMTYGYDFEDRMTTAGAVTMVYDGDGNRVSRTAGGVTTRFLVDDLTPTGYAQVAEELVSGAVAVRYTHGIQRVSQSRAGATHFYGYDGGGSVRQLTDASGAVTDTYAYDAFGVLIGGTGSTVNSYRYRGEQWDASVGMYHLRARWYEAGKGRFWTADKWEPSAAKACCFANNELRLEELFSLAHHLYAYAVSDPVNNVDPTGERAMSRTLSLGWTLIALGVRLERAWPTIRNIGAGSAAFLCATAVILKRSNVQVPPPVRDPIEAICDALDIFDVF